LGEVYMNAARDESIERSTVLIRVRGVELEGDLVLPAAPAAVVIHAGSRTDARALVDDLASRGNVASLAIDLRAIGDEALDVAVLAQRLAVATDWVVMHDTLRWHPLAYCASGIEAAAALVTASARREVRAVAVRAGRPDLAGAALENVRVPTLLVVDEAEDALVALNRSARPRLRTSELAIVRRDAMSARVEEWLLHALL
jgi:putative phosphoribosyl transferase